MNSLVLDTVPDGMLGMIHQTTLSGRYFRGAAVTFDDPDRQIGPPLDGQ